MGTLGPWGSQLVSLEAPFGKAEGKGHSHGEGRGAKEQLILRAPQAMLSSLEFSKDRSMCPS